MVDIINKEQFLDYLNQSLSAAQLFKWLGYKITGGVNTKTFERIEKRYNVDIRKQIEENKKNYELNKLNEVHICKQCGKEFKGKYSKWSSGVFCCRKCAIIYASNINKEQKNQKNSQIKKDFSYINGEKVNLRELYNKNPKICPICNKIIPYERRKRKTCCKECEHLLKINNGKNHKNLKLGGYVPNSCRGKCGYYKGIYCDSTYELVYLIYCLDHNIDIKRCEETFEYEYEGKIHTYHPDFVVNNELIEIKNYYRELNDIKLQAVNKPIKILYYDDLCDIFEYVSKTYNKKYSRHSNNFYELYDDYKPKYTYICDTCGKEFSKNRKVKTELKFCSRKCVGKYNFKKERNNV